MIWKVKDNKCENDTVIVKTGPQENLNVGF